MILASMTANGAKEFVKMRFKNTNRAGIKYGAQQLRCCSRLRGRNCDESLFILSGNQIPFSWSQRVLWAAREGRECHRIRRKYERTTRNQAYEIDASAACIKNGATMQQTDCGLPLKSLGSSGPLQTPEIEDSSPLSNRPTASFKMFCRTPPVFLMKYGAHLP